MGSGPFFGGLGSGDVEAIMARMTDDCVHESTGPTPDGQLHDGPAAVRSVWEQFFGDTKDPKFTEEDTFRGTAPRLVAFHLSELNGQLGVLSGGVLSTVLSRSGRRSLVRFPRPRPFV